MPGVGVRCELYEPCATIARKWPRSRRFFNGSLPAVALYLVQQVFSERLVPVKFGEPIPDFRRLVGLAAIAPLPRLPQRLLNGLGGKCARSFGGAESRQGILRQPHPAALGFDIAEAAHNV